MPLFVSKSKNGQSNHYTVDYNPIGDPPLKSLEALDGSTTAIQNNPGAVDGSLDAEGWNNFKNGFVSGDAVGDNTISLNNFVHVDIDLSADDGATVNVDNAKRGNIHLGDGVDRLNLTLTTNSDGWSNKFLIDTGDGDDVVVVGRGQAQSNAQITNGKFTTIVADLGDGDDKFVSVGAHKAKLRSKDDVSGGEGDDIIRTGAGRDHLDGGEGDDLMKGGGGRDMLIAGSGDNKLTGDGDQLYGKNLIKNGGFEKHKGDNGPSWGVRATDVKHWSVTDNGPAEIVTVDNYFGLPLANSREGNQSWLDLDASPGDVAIAQTVLVKGEPGAHKMLTLSLDAAIRGSLDYGGDFKILWDGEVIETITFSEANAWKKIVVEIPATTGEHTLGFMGADGVEDGNLAQNIGASIDNVRLSVAKNAKDVFDVTNQDSVNVITDFEVGRDTLKLTWDGEERSLKSAQDFYDLFTGAFDGDEDMEDGVETDNDFKTDAVFNDGDLYLFLGSGSNLTPDTSKPFEVKEFLGDDPTKDYNLTSLGRTTIDDVDYTVWRVRNETDSDVTATLRGSGTDYAATFTAKANSDTCVLSPIVGGPATHIVDIFVDEALAESFTKAAGNQTANGVQELFDDKRYAVRLDGVAKQLKGSTITDADGDVTSDPNVWTANGDWSGPLVDMNFNDGNSKSDFDIADGLDEDMYLG